MRKMLLVLVIALHGCDGGESAAPRIAGDPAPGVSGIEVLAISGVDYALDGTYDAGCHDHAGASPDSRDKFTVSGSSYVSLELNYTSTDGTCSAGETERLREEASIVASLSAGAISGWVGIVGSPAANDGSLVGTGASYTPLVATVTRSVDNGVDVPAQVGATRDLFFVVDNTPGGPVALYRQTCYTVSATCMTTPYADEKYLLL